MVLHCAVHLDRDPPVFSPGDIIEGVLVLSSTWADKLHGELVSVERLKICDFFKNTFVTIFSGISVKLVKKMEVEWDTYQLYDRNRMSNVEDVTFLSECEILDASSANVHPVPSTSSSSAQGCSSGASSSSSSSCALLSSGPLTSFNSKRGIVITRGVTHRYPFLLKIAYELDLPSNFRGTYGYIAYKLVVFLRTPKPKSGNILIGALKDIGIFPILDLNHLDLSLQRPADEKRVFKSLFGYNYVFMKCHLDKRAFLPEELVSFTVEVTNKSPATLDGVEVNLNMSTHFAIYGASKIENTTLLRIRGPCITQGEHGIWGHSFNFPAFSLPTGLGALSRLRSKSIDLQYTLLFTLEVSKAEKFSIPFPIVIGTVPFGHNSRVVCMNHHLSSDALDNHSGRRSGGNVTPSSSGSSSFNENLRRTPESTASFSFVSSGRFRRPRSKSTSSLPPSYSSANLQYQCSLMRRAETRKITSFLHHILKSQFENF